MWILTLAIMTACLALLIGLALIFVLGLAVLLVVRIGRLRPLVLARMKAHARRVERERRASRVEQAGGTCVELDSLVAIVDRIRAIGPTEAARCELDPLLDAYAELEIARSSCLMREGQFNCRSGAACSANGGAVTRQVHERRSELHLDRTRRLEQINDELAAISDLIRHYAERASLPDIDLLIEDDEIGRRLVLLEPAPTDRDAARGGDPIRASSSAPR